MRILIVSNTVWNDNNSFGNSFSNIFGENGNYEIANISCQEGEPDTMVCSRFFQISERSIINSILGKGSSGKEVFKRCGDDDKKVSSSDSSLKNKAKILRWQIFFWARDMVWATSRWKSNALDKYILDFNPDIIFQPVYYSSYINKIGLHAHKLTGKPMVGYISDDCYTLKQYSYSPLFWIDRLIKRRYVKRAIDSCEVLFTITEKQKNEYNSIFGEKCKVLFKGGDFSNFDHKKEQLNDTLQFVYTGNLGSGRWKSLALIGDAIAKTGKQAELIIYSQTPLSDKQKKRLLASGVVKFMGGVHSSAVKQIQRDADVLIHVESFEKKERYSARLSFSTKIVDYMEAGRCILAVGWEESGAVEYLKEYDGAIVISDKNHIDMKVSEIINNSSEIIKYGIKGFELGYKFHQSSLISEGLYNTLLTVNFKSKDK